MHVSALSIASQKKKKNNVQLSMKEMSVFSASQKQNKKGQKKKKNTHIHTVTMGKRSVSIERPSHFKRR